MLSNNEQDSKLVVNLEDPILKLKDISVSSKTQGILTSINLISLPQLLIMKTQGKEQLMDYSISHVAISNQ
jgi:hypothetical protein